MSEWGRPSTEYGDLLDLHEFDHRDVLFKGMDKSCGDLYPADHPFNMHGRMISWLGDEATAEVYRQDEAKRLKGVMGSDRKASVVTFVPVRRLVLVNIMSSRNIELCLARLSKLRDDSDALNKGRLTSYIAAIMFATGFGTTLDDQNRQLREMGKSEMEMTTDLEVPMGITDEAGFVHVVDPMDATRVHRCSVFEMDILMVKGLSEAFPFADGYYAPATKSLRNMKDTLFHREVALFETKGAVAAQCDGDTPFADLDVSVGDIRSGIVTVDEDEDWEDATPLSLLGLNLGEQADPPASVDDFQLDMFARQASSAAHMPSIMTRGTLRGALTRMQTVLNSESLLTGTMRGTMRTGARRMPTTAVAQGGGGNFAMQCALLATTVVASVVGTINVYINV